MGPNFQLCPMATVSNDGRPTILSLFRDPANQVTLLGMAFALLSMHAAFLEAIRVSCAFMLVSAILDCYDGFTAKRKKNRNLLESDRGGDGFPGGYYVHRRLSVHDSHGTVWIQIHARDMLISGLFGMCRGQAWVLQRLWHVWEVLHRHAS